MHVDNVLFNEKQSIALKNTQIRLQALIFHIVDIFLSS